MNNLKKIRESKGMTQTFLSDKSGISNITISKIENTENYDISFSTAKKLANVLGVKVSDIFCD